MKKTALTMTDSEKPGAEKISELTEPHAETPEEENKALRIIVAQQEIAMDMIMRKYREQVDSLTKVSQVDVRKLNHKRYLATIVNQANKMDEMTKMMRKNLLIIFKYEEIMRQIESENEGLKTIVRKLTLAAKEAEKKAEISQVFKNDAESQTHLQESVVSTVNKSVGTSMAEFGNLENGVLAPEKQDKCTEMILYTPFPDSFAYFGTIHNTRPLTNPLDVDAAFDLYVNRFSDETKKPNNESVSLPNITLTEIGAISPSEGEGTEELEDSSEGLASSTRAIMTEVDELSSENSIISLVDDNCSKQDPTDDVFDDIS